jgi:hypothetical protein
VNLSKVHCAHAWKELPQWNPLYYYQYMIIQNKFKSLPIQIFANYKKKKKKKNQTNKKTLHQTPTQFLGWRTWATHILHTEVTLDLWCDRVLEVTKVCLKQNSTSRCFSYGVPPTGRMSTNTARSQIRHYNTLL